MIETDKYLGMDKILKEGGKKKGQKKKKTNTHNYLNTIDKHVNLLVHETEHSVVRKAVSRSSRPWTQSEGHSRSHC